MGQSSTGATGLCSSGCNTFRLEWLKSSKKASTAETPYKYKHQSYNQKFFNEDEILCIHKLRKSTTKVTKSI